MVWMLVLPVVFNKEVSFRLALGVLLLQLEDAAMATRDFYLPESDLALAASPNDVLVFAEI